MLADFAPSQTFVSVLALVKAGRAQVLLSQMKPVKAPADVARLCECFLTHLKAPPMIPDAPNVRVDVSDTWTSAAEPRQTEHAHSAMRHGAAWS